MTSLGEWLRAAREQKGLTLEQVAEKTCISLDQLNALEAETFATFSSDLHTRGFVRSYAQCVGLDPGEATERYTRLRDPRAKIKAAAPVPGLQERGRRSNLLTDALLAFVVVALLSLGGLWVYQFGFGAPAPATPTAGPAPTPTVTPSPVYEGTEYTLDVELDYAGHKLQVRERVDYTNVTSQTLTQLVLNVSPNSTRNAFKLNDARVEMDGERVRAEASALDVRLTVALPHGLEPMEHVALFLDFSLSLPQVQANAEFSAAGLGYSKRSVSVGNWYPIMAPYRADKGWYGLTYFPVGDPYVSDVADYHVTITTTPGVVLAGTGHETTTGAVWRYEVDKARTFAFAASDRYQVIESLAGDHAIRVYFFAENQAAAESVLQTVSQSLSLFGELYGDYPFADYRIAETEFAGGMEFTGLTFLGSTFFDQYDGASRTPLIPLAAHEVAHQWFFGLVGSDQVIEPWLDEALAEYSAYLYYERYLPADTNWWWTYAVDQWAPTGIIDARLFEFRDNRGYMDAVYRRGAQFLRDLRKTMSDPAFFAFLKEYSRRYAYGMATSRDFFDVVRELTTADLVPLQEEYFRQRISR